MKTLKFQGKADAPEVALRVFIVEADEHKVRLGGRRRIALRARVEARERLDLDEQPEAGVREIGGRLAGSDAAGRRDRVRLLLADLRGLVSIFRFRELFARLLVLRTAQMHKMTRSSDPITFDQFYSYRELSPHYSVLLYCTWTWGLHTIFILYM